jgi:thiamine biosynthesis lipoprotein
MIGEYRQRTSVSTILGAKGAQAALWSMFLGLGWMGQGCGPSGPDTSTSPDPWVVQEGSTQGTTFRFVWDGTGVGEVRSSDLDSVLGAVDAAVNLWNPQSELVRLNAWSSDSGDYVFVDSTQVLTLLWLRSEEIWSATGGAFDPTVRPLVELWGFGLSRADSVSPEEVLEALQTVGFSSENVAFTEREDEGGHSVAAITKRNPGISLDFNAIAQGYTVDLVADFLQSRGAKNGMVEIGGEVRCWGKNAKGESWHIAIDAPLAETGTGRVFDAIVLVDNAAICTSGSYRKFRNVGGRRLSHAIDPATGYPVEHNLVSATVRAHTAATADALATACLVMGPERAKTFIAEYKSQHPEERVDAYFLMAQPDGSWDAWMTTGWEGNLIPVEKKTDGAQAQP